MGSISKPFFRFPLSEEPKAGGQPGTNYFCYLMCLLLVLTSTKPQPAALQAFVPLHKSKCQFFPHLLSHHQ